MAHTFSTKIWDIQGEYQFDNYLKLLNPSMQVTSLSVYEHKISIELKVIENGGVYTHGFNIQTEGLEETDLNLLVDAAMAQLFPEAVVRE